MSTIAYVGLGANLGRREATVLAAARALERRRAARVVRLSSLYETDPVGIGDAPRFINAVAQVVPLLPPGDLLQRLKVIENEMGRAGGHGQSREIDLDLVTCGDDVFHGEDLVLPHPRFHQRAFVLIPLREIAPGFVCPRTGLGIGELIGRLADGGGVARVSGRSLVLRG
jgi:2-amino-4-hydroxy-6-hydroxymethyldihydropteridine diphosphokinase